MPDPTPPLRIAVLTRTGRTSGARMAHAIHATRHTLCGVLAEKRSSMIRRIASRRSLGKMFKQHGFVFLARKLAQAVFHKGKRIPLPDVPCRVVESLNSAEAVSTLHEWNADVLVVANAPLLKPNTFQTARLGAVNFHSGRLPEYGGLASEFWALYDGQQQAWATIHEVAEQLDSGGILKEAAVDIDAIDTPETLHEKLVEQGSRLVIDILDAYAAGHCPVLRQPGPARLRPWPSPKDRRTLSSRLRAHR